MTALEAIAELRSLEGSINDETFTAGVRKLENVGKLVGETVLSIATKESLAHLKGLLGVFGGGINKRNLAIGGLLATTIEELGQLEQQSNRQETIREEPSLV